MKTPRAITRLLTAAALTLAVIVPASFTAPAPAQAGLDACLALATDFGLDDVKKAAGFVAEHGECLGDLTNPSFLAVVAAVFIIQAATNAYGDENSCTAALGGIAGKPIAAALAGLGSALNLPDDVISKLSSFASDQGAQGLVEFMNATPGLNVISNNWGCACAVRYSGVADTIAKIVEDTLSCTGGLLESGLDAIGNLYNDLFGGNGLTPGVQEEQENYIYPCDGGWYPGTYDQYSGSYVNGSCWCPEPSKEVKSPYGNKLACKCPAGQGYKNGTCSPCSGNAIVGSDGQCKACGTGQKPGKDGYGQPACVAACPSGYVLSGGLCQACNAGTYAVTPYNTSAGSCKTCPAGMTSAAGAASCYSVCKGWEEWDDKTKSCKRQCGPGERYSTPKEFGFSCTKCPADTRLDEATNSCVACPKGTSSGEGSTSCKALCEKEWDYWDETSKSCKPQCGAGQHWNKPPGNLPAGSYSQSCNACPPNTEYVHSTNQCSSCPKGMSWSKDGSGVGRCMCPEGTNRQGGICVPNESIGTPKPNDGPPKADIPKGISSDQPKPCPISWHWSATKKKCVPGLRPPGSGPERTAPPPSNDNSRGGASAPPPDYRTVPQPYTGKP